MFLFFATSTPPIPLLPFSDYQVAQVTNTKQRKIFTKRHKRVKMVVTLVPVTYARG